MQRGLSATYPAPNSTIFETKDVKRFPQAFAGKKFQISAQGVFQVTKTAKNVYYRASNGTIFGDGNHFTSVKLVAYYIFARLHIIGQFKLS